ncbi:MAG TPA: phosphopantetheine-binding protein [Acidimicrobiales bacterium]|nr:phosphopantetheine-binding protein [Acidimicrobiales bacterium]
MTDLEPRVRALVSAHLDIDPDRLRPEARLGADLCIDSLAAIELALVLEDAFDIALPDEEREDVRTYDDVVQLVRDKVAANAG